jgi:hypothetical protein
MIVTLNLGFKMNLVSTFFCLWTALLIPELREDVFDSKPGDLSPIS